MLSILQTKKIYGNTGNLIIINVLLKDNPKNLIRSGNCLIKTIIVYTHDNLIK